MDNENKKDIEVVTGNGTEIEISPVSEHLKALKPKTKEEKSKKNIVIPGVEKGEKK